MSAKKPKAPTQTEVTIVIMGVIDSVDEEAIEHTVKIIEKAAKRQLVSCGIDVAHTPLVEPIKYTDEQKAQIKAYVEKEYGLPKPEALAGSAQGIKENLAKAAAALFS